jgi:predicted dehydrogenase
MSNSMTRRRFLRSTAAAGIASAAGSGLLNAAEPAKKPATTSYSGPRLNIGIVGTGGRGHNHVEEVHAIPQANVVALCDVDSNILANAAKTIPDAKQFVDFREMLKMQRLDAVLVATPDHTHGVITAAALRAGKHVYSEKPLCHTVAEVRAVTDLARQSGLVTQLGIQIHALETYRRVVELVRADAIGPVREVHIWNNRVRKAYSAEETAPPPNFNYDLWLGPVSMRPFRKGYHPYSWRQWWSFGSGLLGDIGCHLMDVAFWALDLKHPISVVADGGPMSYEN